MTHGRLLNVRAELNWRLVLAIGAFFAFVGAGFLTPTPPVSAASPSDKMAVQAVTALSGSYFNAGLIIPDDLFYDAASMTSDQIQAFLDQRIGSCANGQCLNVGVVNFPGRATYTSSNTGKVVCNAIAPGTIKVSELIYRTQVACGISAKVILVTLQKEQGLITNSAPSPTALSHAMGMACPDTAPCDPGYAGLATQIVSGTAQLKCYKTCNFAKQPGLQPIQFSPNPACGSTNVLVQNYATAALYSYTPYQPNAAALANLTGTGDGCSSYGNRNFWVFYYSWFGAPITDPTVKAYWSAQGGAGGALGSPTTAGSTFSVPGNGDGFVQVFAGGYVYSSKAGVFTVKPGTPLENAWTSAGWIRGKLGWPVAEAVCSGAVCSQQFQGGAIQGSTIIG